MVIIKIIKNICISMMLLTVGKATAADSIIDYSSQSYLNQQYEMLKITFKELEVSQNHDGRSVKINIPSSYGFKTGHHTLKRPMKDTLSKMAHFLKTYPETTLEVVGHTDNVGSELANIKLGQLRATAVADELLGGQVSPYRIKASSDGEEMPLCNNKTQRGKECNRRVEILVTLEQNLEW